MQKRFVFKNVFHKSLFYTGIFQRKVWRGVYFSRNSPNFSYSVPRPHDAVVFFYFNQNWAKSIIINKIDLKIDPITELVSM